MHEIWIHYESPLLYTNQLYSSFIQLTIARQDFIQYHLTFCAVGIPDIAMLLWASAASYGKVHTIV